MAEQRNPSVERFEQEVAAKNYEAASQELLNILSKLDANFGMLHGIEMECPKQLANLEYQIITHFCTRMANAITQLFSDPNLSINEAGFQRFMLLQRWINMVFASSPYVNADHILANYNRNPEPNSLWTAISLDNNVSAFYKFAILYLPESNVDLDFQMLWNALPEVCASLCFALQSPRFIGTETAFGKRGKILQWFPQHLATIANLNRVPSNISHDVYMHCSYDIAANKHNVKHALNQVIRRHMLTDWKWEDLPAKEVGTKNDKPVMVVVLEHFHASHSIYRTHSTSMVAAREHFHLIGIGNHAVDQKGREVFDEFHEVERNSVYERMSAVRKICEEVKPAVLYMPSIGMDMLPIFVSNARFAPIQAIALGHPATTHSEFIEYVIVEDDYVGSEECFSEKLLRLPKDALPYVPSALAPKEVKYNLRKNPEVVNIGVASTTMKLNPYFLKACQAIRDRAKVKVHFHFAMGQSSGVTHPYVERFLKTYLGDDVTAHPHQGYDKYLETLNKCDMMINPFPFGNTNGIIDMVTLGLVGVCKTGPEVHEHIDEGLFKRLGLPEWLITKTADEYVDCAIRLAENHEERLALRRHIIENNGLKTLFTGDPRPMGRVFLQKLQEWQAAQATAPAAPAEEKTEVEAPKAKATKTTSKAKKPAAKKTTARKSKQ
ncbi:adhesin [Kingella negevensis]|uniref:Adhesin n=1 Tax=Kingella negevensis TaxID=1522312 RepID=A0A238HE06_9NEIS|nr:adhesin [Kingella negevensis]MDK4679235.1 adhesin [Kingella negevensis]MDK4683043.1 adhesin [Kingella negevensis]MDK4683768.1 adhesin [Kingella negevensis]MDK4691243.1 adhesin [Kingella negevensis]MDK4693609.1 adhesin [Kingella negevensis]